MRRLLAPLATAVLVLWVLGVTGAPAWGQTVNWTLFAVALVLLGLRAVA